MSVCPDEKTGKQSLLGSSLDSIVPPNLCGEDAHFRIKRVVYNPHLSCKVHEP